MHPDLLGGLVSVAVAVLLFSRFGLHGTLTRDEAVYAYGGQQLAEGLPPYVSIVDPKTPMATLLAGAGAGVARLAGVDDLAAIRLVFLLCSCLTVLVAYLLATRLWQSRVAGLAAAATFASFRGFAMDAGSGPDAKTPGVLLVAVAMLLMLDRRWFWAALCGSCAFLVWQPLGLYPALTVLLAVAGAARPAARLRSAAVALAGALVPVAVTLGYFASVGAVGPLVQATVLFPLEGIVRADQTVGGRLARIPEVVGYYYGASGVLLAAGLLVLLLRTALSLRRRPLRAGWRGPLVCVVTVSLAGQVAYAATDFQSYPDVYPFLVYGALGIGGGVAAVVSRVGTAAALTRRVVVVVLALGVLTTWSAVSFAQDRRNDGGLRAQELQACAITRLLPERDGLYALGDPTPLVLTHRRNVDPFIMLTAGLREWKVARVPGAFDGWMGQIAGATPSVVVASWVQHDTLLSVGDWLQENGYRPFYIGRWRVFLDQRARVLARQHGIGLRQAPTAVPTGPVGAGGRALTRSVCR